MLLPTSRKPAPIPRPPKHAISNTQYAIALALCALVAAGAVLLTGAQAQAPSFANPAFEVLWDRTDGVVASGEVQRPWVWGPAPSASMNEAFAGLPGNAHLVQFFDKGRMELNDPSADPNDPFYVTNGRLAIELISGQAQTGLTSFANYGTAQINLASDADDPSAPTYGSFNGVSNLPGTGDARRAPDRTGTVVRTAIDRMGVTQPWPEDHPDYGVRITHYEEITGHNIPGIFWDYLNQQTTIMQGGEVVQGPLFYPWFAVTGYPISEPYWSYVKVAGKYTDVLIQAYERRVLTYVPHLPSPFKVQMGNIGQHYYDWRYGGGTKPATPRPVATPTSPGLPPKAKVTIDGIEYKKSVVDLNGTFCIITNRGDRPLSFDNWRLDSPKWGIVDVFRFPNGVVLAPGASMRVHSGVGRNSETDIYMFRPTVMWDSQNYDYAVLYDNYGRQVADFFPAGDVGAPPTTPPSGPTPTRVPGTTPPPTAEPGKPTSTPEPGKPTNTPASVPSPVGTGPVPVATVTRTRTPQPSGSATVSPTRTPGGSAATATPTGTGSGSCTEVMVNGDFEAFTASWFQQSNIAGDDLITDDEPYGGSRYSAFLGYWPDAVEDLWQVVTIPATASRVDLTYWRRMESDDTGNQEHDFMRAEVRNQAGTEVLRTLETITNRSTKDTWERATFSLVSYKGQTVRIQFHGTTDVSIHTNFLIDNISLQSCP